MNKYGTKIAACALMGTLSLSGHQMTLEARLNNSAGVPAAGVAVVLNEGSSIQELRGEVVQNIAYIESVSGLQPNIVLASEKVTLADRPLSIVGFRSNSSKAASELVQKFMDELGEVQVEPVTEADIEERKQIERTQTETDQKDDLQTSAGFSAVESYEEIESEVASTEEAKQETTESPESESSESESSIIESSESESSTIVENTESESSTVEETENTESETESTEIEETTEEETEEETTQEEQDFSGLVIAQVTNYVNVRNIPSEEGEIVGKLYDKSVGEFVEEKDGWYKITSGNCTGYVKGEFCVVGEEAEALAKEVGTTYAIVNTTTLKVRKEASTESSVLGLVPMQEELIVVEELDGWVKIAIEEGDGYVSRDYVNLRTDFVHAESKEEETARLAKEAKAREEARAAAEAARATRAQTATNEAPVQKSADNQATIAAAQNIAAVSEGSAMGKEVINYATQFVGNPYVYGGSSLTNGTDCSGFVMSVYANFGVSLPHSSSALRSQGYDVGGMENAQPGDIICYSGHVGLYVGNGQIVHASTSKTGIIVSNASYRSVLAVRRIF